MNGSRSTDVKALVKIRNIYNNNNNNNNNNNIHLHFLKFSQ